MEQLMNEQFTQLKQQILNILFSRMNDMQKEAVFQVNGPLLILAGAGSGKTTVLVNRIAYLLKYGNLYHNDRSAAPKDLSFLQTLAAQETISAEDETRFLELVAPMTVNPWNVLAITFTNKAANELKDRLLRAIGDKASAIAAGTFHSICVRILRREIEQLGYQKSFTIYDTDDSVRMIRDALKDVGENDKLFAPKQVLHIISSLKDSMTTPEEYTLQAASDYRLSVIAKIYTIYQNRLKLSNALDFDDIILLTVRLFENFPDVLEHYQNLYKYILVDEYQDTNQLQYKLVSLLSQKHKNLCVVGDDDQSIYKFRGATIENILSFEKQFTDALVIRLEQNYRSTQTILDAANGIIQNNEKRKGKNLWTNNGTGEKVTLYRALDDNAESAYVVKTIVDDVACGKKFADHAILYRMNAQSGNVEKHLVKAGIPYRIIGGAKFFERKEVKDILAYLALINNTADTVRLKRIINEPKRGIGDTTIRKVEQIAEQTGAPMFDVMFRAHQYEAISKKASSIREFCIMIDNLKDTQLNQSLAELFDEVIEKTGYIEYLKDMGGEGLTRIENVTELKSNIIKYEEEAEEPTLSGFLEEIALYTDLDTLNDSDDYVLLMTMHSAKGLEFDTVFMMGMENGLFPGRQNLGNPIEMEEERRLAYVGVTRAKHALYLTNSKQRLIFGSTTHNQPSLFLQEIPPDLLNIIDTTASRRMVQRPVLPKRSDFGEEVSSVGIKSRPKSVAIDFSEGDVVSHKIFGTGTVLSLTAMGNDTLVEIAFDRVGTKKIMANFAKLSKE